jgi:transcriptional regulator with XRE-family HTH domain
MRRTIGRRLREARRAVDLTQQEVAAELQQTRQTISSWEQGRTQPDLILLSRLATLYSISTDRLLMGVDVEAERVAVIARAAARPQIPA